MDILLKNLRPLGQETCDMEVRAGRIARIPHRY